VQKSLDTSGSIIIKLYWHSVHIYWLSKMFKFSPFSIVALCTRKSFRNSFEYSLTKTKLLYISCFRCLNIDNRASLCPVIFYSIQFPTLSLSVILRTVKSVTDRALDVRGSISSKSRFRTIWCGAQLTFCTAVPYRPAAWYKLRVLFYILLTVHLGTVRVNNQFDALL